MDNSFTIGDEVRTVEALRNRGEIHQGRVADIDRVNGKARLHNSGEEWFPLTALENVPCIDPTRRNRNGNTSYLG